MVVSMICLWNEMIFDTFLWYNFLDLIHNWSNSAQSCRCFCVLYRIQLELIFVIFLYRLIFRRFIDNKFGSFIR